MPEVDLYPLNKRKARCAGRLIAVLAILFILTLNCCQSFPKAKIDKAKSIKKKALRAEAPLYTPELWKELADKDAELDGEIWNQTGRFISDNKRIGMLASELKKTAEKTLQEAIKAKARARDKAELKISEADSRLWISRRQTLSKSGPERLKKLNGLSLLLDQSRSDMNSENYIGARITAEKIISEIDSIENKRHNS